MLIKAKFIIEIMGRPAEHIKEALNTLVIKMGSDEGVELLGKTYHDPKKIEKVDNLWTAFADVELSFDNIHRFFNAIMTYMPAHVEIFEPENFKLDVAGINELANYFTATLHKYDAIAKKVVGEKEILIRKLEHLRQGGKLEDVFPPEKKEEKIEGKKGIEENKKVDVNKKAKEEKKGKKKSK
jgi:hypothetical protein